MYEVLVTLLKFTHAETVKLDDVVKLVSAAVIESVEPLKVAAAFSFPATPAVTLPEDVPVFPFPELSENEVPLVSLSFQ